MNIVVLCGGVGAARFLLGLHSLINSGEDLHVTAIVNTGDDDEFYGQYVCPDIDSILYHLAGIHDETRGWGQRDETFHFVETLRTLGIDAWFNLGDRDLALNYIRSEALARNVPLGEITKDLARRLGITTIDIVPMSDEKVTTTITTSDNRTLRMQQYFVHEQCQPTIESIDYTNAPTQCHPDASRALNAADIIIIAPSNPYLSIFPLFAIDEIDSYIQKNKEKVIAISPIISGQAVKGPLAQNMTDHHVDVSCVGIAQLYSDYISSFVIDTNDEHNASQIEDMGITCITANIMLDTDDKRVHLVRQILEMSAP